MANTPISQFVTGPYDTATPAAAIQPTNSNGSLSFDTSNFQPIYTQDQNGNQYINGYAGVTQINGKDVIAYTDSQGNLQQAAGVPTAQNQPSNINQYNAQGNLTGTSVYDPNPAGQGFGNALGTIAKTFAGTALAIAFPELAGTIGSTLGASTAMAPVVGGAALGGFTSAVTGGNPIQGAVLGGIGGYLSGQTNVPGQTTNPVGTELNNINTGIQQPFTGDFNMPPVDYSLNPGPLPNGPGFVPTINPSLPYMNDGTGLVPRTANIPSIDGATGLTANTPNGILNQTGLNNPPNILPVNPLTGQTLGTALNNITTGVNSPFVTGGTNAPTSNAATAATAATAAATPAAATPAASTATSGLLSGLTAGQIAAIGSTVGGLVTGNNTSNAITNAQNIQNAAAGTSQSTLKDIYNQQLGFTKPYQDVGVQGANALSSNLPYFQHQFDVNDLTTNLAPNYQFQLGQGQMANQRAANVGGGALSGNTLTGLNRYTQDYAGNAYQQAFNNYNTQRTGIYNTLSGIAGLGNTANQQAIGAGNTYGTNTTNLATGLAAAQAGATVAQSQNQSNTLNNIINNAALLLGQNNTAPSQGFVTGG